MKGEKTCHLHVVRINRSNHVSVHIDEEHNNYLKKQRRGNSKLVDE